MQNILATDELLPITCYSYYTSPDVKTPEELLYSCKEGFDYN